MFVHELVYKEFQLRNVITKETFPNFINTMVERGVLNIKDGKVTVRKWKNRIGFMGKFY